MPQRNAAKGLLSLDAMTQKPLLPADFLVDEAGTIQRAYYGGDFGDHLGIDEALAWAGDVEGLDVAPVPG